MNNLERKGQCFTKREMLRLWCDLQIQDVLENENEGVKIVDPTADESLLELKNAA